MRGLASILLVAAAAVLGGVSAKSATGDRVLVITSNVKKIKQSYSLLVGGLVDRRFDVDFAGTSEDVVLEAYGEALYDHVVLLAPTSKRLSGLQTSEIMQFMRNGGNVVVGGGADPSNAVKSVAAELGVQMHGEGTRVVDMIRGDGVDGGEGSVFSTSAWAQVEPVVGKLAGEGKRVSHSVLFGKGVGMSVAEDNYLALPALSGESTTVSSGGEEQGSGITLVAAVQGRNNARAVVLGSTWMCSDEARLTPLSWSTPLDSTVDDGRGETPGANANGYLCDTLLQWAMQERGVLKSSNEWHRKADGSMPSHQLEQPLRADLPKSMFPAPEVAPQSLTYRIKDELQYYIDLHTWDGETGQYTPYVAEDVQLEFVMLDPYVRVGMVTDGNGTYAASFQSPDVYGIYKFRVHYRRRGLTTVHVEDQVSVRPYRHNEYERFISQAYPYYASAFIMMVGFLVFSWNFLHAVDDSKGKGTEGEGAAGAGGNKKKD